MADDVRDSDYEMDSDMEDLHGDELGTWLGQLQSLTTSLESSTFDRTKTQQKLTPTLAIESFRSSFLLNDNEGGDEEIDLDAILGELCEIENQLKCQNTDLSSGDTMIPSGTTLDDVIEIMDSPNVTDSMDFKSKTQAWINNTPPLEEMSRPEQWKRQSQASQASSSSSGTSHKSQPLSDLDRDSAYLENESLPSSESYLSVGTSSSNQSSHGSNHVTYPAANPLQSEISQASKLKEEKIKMALEKIKDTKLERLFIRAFSEDGSSKAILVDERMDVRRVWHMLIEKNHCIPDMNLTVVEHLPTLHMERVLEDHESLVAVKLTWPRDSTNRILFTKRPIKYDLFRCPEAFLLGDSYADRGTPWDRNARGTLLEEFFTSNQVPEVEGLLHLKTEGKKVWKKVYCVLRASGIYYNPKGKTKSSRDLQNLVQLETEELYLGVNWKKKHKSPTDFTFALKHPCVMKKSSRFIKYFCADDDLSWRKWINGIRIAKHGHVVFHNYRESCHDVQMWDTRVAPTMTSNGQNVNKVKVTTSLQRRESLPAPSIRHHQFSPELQPSGGGTLQRRASTNYCLPDNERQPQPVDGDNSAAYFPRFAFPGSEFSNDSGHESSAESLLPGSRARNQSQSGSDRNHSQSVSERNHSQSVSERNHSQSGSDRNQSQSVSDFSDCGTLKKSSRVPILPVTTDTAKSLTLKRTDFVAAQPRASILNGGEMTIQRSRKFSDGNIDVKNWRQSRNTELFSMDTTSNANNNIGNFESHVRKGSYSAASEIQSHYRRKSLESDCFLRDSPRDVAGGQETAPPRIDALRNSVLETRLREARQSMTSEGRVTSQSRDSGTLTRRERQNSRGSLTSHGSQGDLLPLPPRGASVQAEEEDNLVITPPEQFQQPPPEALYDEPYNENTNSETEHSNGEAGARVLPPPMAPLNYPHMDNSTTSCRPLQSGATSRSHDDDENPYAAIGNNPQLRPSLTKSSTYDGGPPFCGSAAPPPLPPSNRASSPVGSNKPPKPRMSVPPPPPPSRTAAVGPQTAPKPRISPSKSLGCFTSDEPVYSMPPCDDIDDDIDDDICDLPPPPPELLQGLYLQDNGMEPPLPEVPNPMPPLSIGGVCATVSSSDPSPGRKKALPPPPPKRSSTTQLSNTTSCSIAKV